jgi:hypothetical protein
LPTEEKILMKLKAFVLLLGVSLVVSVTAWARDPHCQTVGGVLMTNIGAITPGSINLGPVFGDLKGAVAAQIVGQNADGSFNVQHYWVTSEGDTITMAQAKLHPTATSDPNVVAVLWGNYLTTITGGTGRYMGATGTVSYFGLADFSKLTLVLRYSGEVCYAR